MTAESLRTTAPAPRSSRVPASALVRLLPMAGSLYVLAWVLGLVLGPAAPGPTASAAGIQGFYVQHADVVVLQVAARSRRGRDRAGADGPRLRPGAAHLAGGRPAGSGSPGWSPPPSPSCRSLWR